MLSIEAKVADLEGRVARLEGHYAALEARSAAEISLRREDEPKKADPRRLLCRCSYISGDTLQCERCAHAVSEAEIVHCETCALDYIVDPEAGERTCLCGRTVLGKPVR